MRFRLRRLLAPLAHPPKLDELLQHTPTRIRPPSPDLQRAPRQRQHERRAARAAGLPHRRREVVERMGDHTVREERIPAAPCRGLFQSGTAVRPLPLSPLRQLTRLALRAGIRPTTTSWRTYVR